MTAEQIRTRLEAIDEAIFVVATSGQSYTLNTGHGSQQVTRANLTSLRKYRDELANDLRRAEGESDIVSIHVRRH